MSLKDVQLNRGHLQIEERPLYTGGGEGGGREGGEGGREGGREEGREGGRRGGRNYFRMHCIHVYVYNVVTQTHVLELNLPFLYARKTV